MKCIEDVDEWLKGKTIERVDCTAVNCNIFYFTDNTAVLMDVLYLGQGLYGPMYYEIDPNRPAWEQ